MLRCTRKGCGRQAEFGFDRPRCREHRLTCDVCEAPATLFAPEGQLCSTHAEEARAIEMRGAYPSPAAIRSIVARG